MKVNEIDLSEIIFQEKRGNRRIEITKFDLLLLVWLDKFGYARIDTFVTDEYDEATIVRQKKYLAAIEDLKVGKVDCVVMDELPAKEIVNSNTGIKILNGALTNDSYGMVVKKGNKELLDAINTVLQNLKDEGKIDEFIIKHTEK